MADEIVDEPLLRLDGRHVWNFWQNQEEVYELPYERRLTCYWNRIDQVSHPDILPLLHEAGFGYVSMIIQGAKLNLSLISALVERWRPETHTFHLPSGEATITLQDVAYQLGLPVEGHAITGKAEDNWFLLGRELLGVDPVDLDGGRVLITWLDEHFTDLPNNASIQLKEQFARAHILRVIGGILMSDKSRNKVHLMWLRHLRVLSDVGKFSWGSAVLAYLFRELCKEIDPSKHVIGGCLLLLQSWAWFRMPFIRPTLHQPTPYIFPLIRRWIAPLSHVGLPDCQRDFRLLIDKNDEFVWTPYDDTEISRCVPQPIFQGAQVWMSMVPLINYVVIEWHPVDRVLRQFNYVQPIPQQPINLDSLHCLTRQGKTNVNWRSHHSSWIMQWADRYSRRPDYQPFETYSVTYGYFDWYVANGKSHILIPAERQRELYARPQNRPPTRRAQLATPRRRQGNNTGESSTAPPQPQPPVADPSTPIAPHAFSAFQHMGSPSEGFFTNIVHPYMLIYGTPTQHHYDPHCRWRRIPIFGSSLIHHHITYFILVVLVGHVMARVRLEGLLLQTMMRTTNPLKKKNLYLDEIQIGIAVHQDVVLVVIDIIRLFLSTYVSLSSILV
ncbi:hypothetical protein GQ457_03G026320 [Hibiscus cannabinus]